MINGRLIGQVLGLILCALSAAMLVPAMIDASVGHADWQIFLVSSVIVGYLGASLSFATRYEGRRNMTIRDAFLITASCWIVIPAFAAIPFIGRGYSVTDGYFEAMSGLTTTGSTIMSGLDDMPPGVLVWRAMLQWIGGVGIIVMAMVMLPMLRIGGMQLFLTESSDKGAKVVAQSFALVVRLMLVYFGMTFACAGLYYAFGMSGFDAICHALTTLSTGGFSTHDSSFLYFKSVPLDWVAVIFMLAGSLPFTGYVRVLGGDPMAMWRLPEVRGLVMLLAAVSIVMAVWLSFHLNVSFVAALRFTAFNVVSVVSTTGFMDTDYLGWGPQVFGVFLVLTFLGGCTGSTAGGMKMLRLQVLRLMLNAQVHRLISPHRVVRRTYAGRVISEEVLQSVMAFLAAYLGATALLTIAVSALGIDLVTALTAVVTAIGNVGPGLGDIIGPTGNFAAMPNAAKWLLALAMMLGRLELFTILVLLVPAFWR